MRKVSMKLFTAMVAVALIAGVTIFYACEKEGKNNNSEKNFVKESEFVARNYDGVCLLVDVFRDEDNNAQCVFNAVADDPKITGGFIVSEKLDLKPKQTKDDESLTIEIPNDAIYWLIPLSGDEPVKFEPTNDMKVASGPSQADIYCICSEGTPGGSVPSNSSCEVVKGTEKSYCAPRGGLSQALTCGKCLTYIRVSIGGGGSIKTIVGGAYLVQSDIITINGIIYE